MTSTARLVFWNQEYPRNIPTSWFVTHYNKNLCKLPGQDLSPSKTVEVSSLKSQVLTFPAVRKGLLGWGKYMAVKTIELRISWQQTCPTNTLSNWLRNMNNRWVCKERVYLISTKQNQKGNFYFYFHWNFKTFAWTVWAQNGELLLTRWRWGILN